MRDRPPPAVRPYLVIAPSFLGRAIPSRARRQASYRSFSIHHVSIIWKIVFKLFAWVLDVTCYVLDETQTSRNTGVETRRRSVFGRAQSCHAMMHREKWCATVESIGLNPQP